jgi:hypothetical protein
MKALLMHRDRDFALQQHSLFDNRLDPQDLIQDLELESVFDAMARGDDFLLDIAKKAVLIGLTDVDAVLYRQSVLKDCLKHPDVVRELYQLPLESIERKRRRWLGIGTFTRYPSAVLGSGLELMHMFLGLLWKLKQIAEEHSSQFESEGFTVFFDMVKRELTSEYLTNAQEQLDRLRFPRGVLINAHLGRGNEGVDYTLRKQTTRSWLQNLLTRDVTYSFAIAERDDAGAKALGELRDRGINQVANALAQSADHIDRFFDMLRVELAFYIGCLNLYEQLNQSGNPICFPTPVSMEQRKHSFNQLYDASLALILAGQVVGSTLNCDSKDLVVITGANQGGKSVFLRSIGQAQLMMQCGMFVPAVKFRSNLCTGVFTHYWRREDVNMESGKLDEELSRMNEIVEEVGPNSLILFNESFAATNEHEGSEIAYQITAAMLDRHVKIFFVTHLYEFAHRLSKNEWANASFLLPERMEDGARTYRIIEGEPLETSHGADAYKLVFEKGQEASDPDK